jgi:hypothetical protein
MFGSKFYFGTIRKYVVLFGFLFNDINIDRTDKDGKLVDTIRVPLKYAPKEKVLQRTIEDPNIEKKDSITLPVMSFEMINLYYDESRATNPVSRIAQKGSDPNHMKYQYSPTPYNFQFALYIFVKNRLDGLKIVEQILPMFRPEWNITAHMIPEMEQEDKRDVSVVLNSVEPSDLYEGSYQQRQVIIWQLDFTLKGYFWSPIKEKPIIKFVKTNFRDSVSNTIVNSVTVQPGLTQNGTPTSIVSESIDALLINVDDDYGYCEIIGGAEDA